MEAHGFANGKRYVLETLEGSTGFQCLTGSNCCCQDNVRARLLLEGQPEALFTFNTVDLAAFESFVAAETVVRSILEAGAHAFTQVEKIFVLRTGTIQEILGAHQRQGRPPPAVIFPVPWQPACPLTSCVLAGNSLETHIVIAGILGEAGCYLSFPKSHLCAQADPVRAHRMNIEGVARSREGLCAKCGGSGRLIRCRGCKQVNYCSKDCRRADKPAHERLCSIAQRIRL